MSEETSREVTPNKDSMTAEIQSQNTPSFVQTFLVAIACSMLTLLTYILVFQPQQAIKANQEKLVIQAAHLNAIEEQIKISREELSAEMTRFIDENYGDISERDEKIEKLLIYFKQQDARLSNIEEALAQF